ncbi:MAG: phosphohistidine phosphatase SixA [Nitrospinota bacterium]|nr:phosphohistidine phosphatase SixA [Nitrospinota bacterium]
MDLYILRHAVAEARSADNVEDDGKRPLTAKGRAKMSKIAKGMKKLGVKFDLLLSSPAIRAKDTARIVAAEFNAKKKLKLSMNLAVGGNQESLVTELVQERGAPASVVIVGHEPALSFFASVLLTGDGGMAVDLKKGGLIKLQISALGYRKCAKLMWLLTPSQLRRLG